MSNLAQFIGRTVEPYFSHRFAARFFVSEFSGCSELSKIMNGLLRNCHFYKNNKILKGKITITIKAGDTPSGLAKKYGVSVADIMKGAGITDPRKLIAGRTITGTNSAGSTSQTKQFKSTETKTGTGHGSRKTGGGGSQPPKGPGGNGSENGPPKGPTILPLDPNRAKEDLERAGEVLTEVVTEAKDKVVEVIPEIVSEAKETTVKIADKTTDKTIEIVKKITSPNQMQKLIDRGQAPKEIQRVDSMDPKIPNSQAHIHFGSDKAALNMDGTWHDAHKSIPELTNKIKKWILDNGWNLPK